MTATAVGLAVAAVGHLAQAGPGEVAEEPDLTFVALVFMLGAIVFAVVGAWAYHHRSQRARAMAPTARAAGLEYSQVDLFGCTRVAFPLFTVGHGRQVEHVMWRTGANGLDVRVFDYSYYVERKDKNGNVRKHWSHYSCAMARHNGLWPTVHVSRERLLDRVAQALGLPDIRLESEEFNRTFRVQCDDAHFATALLDPRMMEFLLSTGGRLTFETQGRWLLVIAPRLARPAEMVGLLGVADEFLRRIPPVVWHLYPEGGDTRRGAVRDDVPAFDDLVVAPPTDSVARALREEGRDSRDPTPGQEFDLDGRPVTARQERPWR